MTSAGFDIPTDHRVKMYNTKKKKNRFFDLARELKKKLRKMKVPVIPIVFGVLGTVRKDLKR